MTREEELAELAAWFDSPEGQAFNEAVMQAVLHYFRKRTTQEIRDEWRLD